MSDTNLSQTPAPAPVNQTPSPETKLGPEVLNQKIELKPTGEAKPEAKAEGETLLGEKAKPEAKAEAKTAPDKYEAFKPPEGWADKGWELDQTVIDKAVPLFKELGIPQEGAQKLIDLYAAESQREHEAGLALVKDQNDKWISEIKADPEIGGKLDHVKTTVSKAIDSVLGATLGPKFREALNFTGAGNNPDIIRGLFKFGSSLVEGSHVSGKGPATTGQGQTGQKPSLAKALYPNLP